MKMWLNNKTPIIRNPNSTRPWQHVLEALSGYLTLALEMTKKRALIESGLILSESKFEELVLEHSQKRMTEEATEGLTSFLEKRTAYWYQK